MPLSRALITGGAGFSGSHLCDHLIAQEWEVLCVDNLITGSEANIARMMRNRNFRFVRQDVTHYLDFPGPIDFVLHFASPADSDHEGGSARNP